MSHQAACHQSSLFCSSENGDIVFQAKQLFEALSSFELDDKIDAINKIRTLLHEHSPFKSEPVDCVQWIKSELVTANDYNPNSVAPPEMKLLEHSILEDGYTQPIVSWFRDDIYEVIDGFHRHRVGKESDSVRSRIYGYLPAVVINDDRDDKNDRMASTIRHNRARGEHKVDSMAEIVIELKRRFWSDEKIATELGMDADEVLRLQQVTGLASLFSDREFSTAWEATSFDDEDVQHELA
jgi:ParB-like chromosome segregation protein Spo0J